MTYSKKLQDPRWQKKRLLIMEREGFKCQLCEREDITLHIHHKVYNGEPWESDEKDLMCCCKYCHTIIGIVEPNTPFIKTRVSIQDSGQVYITCYVKALEGINAAFFECNSEATECFLKIVLSDVFISKVNEEISTLKKHQS